MEAIRRIPVEAAMERARRAAERLSRDPRVRLVFLFGSTVAPGAREVGDVDVAIRIRPRCSTDEMLRLRAAVGGAAGGDVDLVDLDRAPVVLAHEIAETGRCLFARDSDEELEFVTRAQLRYFDFRHYLEIQSRLIAERQQERLRGSAT